VYGTDPQRTLHAHGVQCTVTTCTCMRVDTVAGCKYLSRVFDTWRVRNLISRTLGLGNYMQNGKLPVGQSGPMPRIYMYDTIRSGNSDKQQQ